MGWLVMAGASDARDRGRPGLHGLRYSHRLWESIRRGHRNGASASLTRPHEIAQAFGGVELDTGRSASERAVRWVLGGEGWKKERQESARRGPIGRTVSTQVDTPRVSRKALYSSNSEN